MNILTHHVQHLPFCSNGDLFFFIMEAARSACDIRPLPSKLLNYAMHSKSRFSALARVPGPEVLELAQGAHKCHEILLLSFPNLCTPWRVEEIFRPAGYYQDEEY